MKYMCAWKKHTNKSSSTVDVMQRTYHKKNKREKMSYDSCKPTNQKVSTGSKVLYIVIQNAMGKNTKWKAARETMHQKQHAPNASAYALLLVRRRVWVGKGRAKVY